MLERVFEKFSLDELQRGSLKGAIKGIDNAADVYRVISELEGYKEVPVTIDQFIDEPYYLGDVLKGGIYSVWRDALREIFPNPFYSPYYEVAFTGAIGLGKTTICRIGFLYNLYRTLLLKDPHEKYGLISTDEIVFALFNATKTLATSVLFEPFEKLIKGSAFFRSILIPTDNDKIKLSNNINIVVGSRFTDALGKNLLEAFLSEANFQSFQGDQAMDNYTNISRRRESRFMEGSGSIPGHFWLDSSKKEENDFLEKHIQKNRGRKGFKVYEKPIWEINKCKAKMFYSGDIFKVFVGDDTHDPLILDEEESEFVINSLSLDKIIDVPVEHRKSFDDDLIGALRDIAGISYSSTFKFFRNKDKMNKCADRTNVFNREEILLSFDGDDQIIDSAKASYFQSPLDKRTPRMVAIDTSLTGDKTGLAASYIKNYKEVNKYDPYLGEFTTFREPVIDVDFNVAINNIPGQEIPFFKVRQFIVQIQKMGYPIAMISMDGYQSADMKQLFIKLGFDCEIISVDRTKDPYTTFRSALNEERCSFYGNKILIKEMVNVEDQGKKIDHPDKVDNEKGSKDVLDAVVASAYSAFVNHEKYNSMMFDHKLEENKGESLYNELMEKVQEAQEQNTYF